ncbi:MAG: PaaI family thioesterase [Bacteroidia bacterium]
MMKSEKWICHNPDYVQDIHEKLERQFFMKHIGFQLDSIELGLVRGSLIIEEKHKQQNFFLHGGVMATAVDIVMGFAAYSLVPKNVGVVTTDLNVSFLNPGIGDKMVAEGRVVKAGNQLVFCEADVWVENGDKKIHTNRATSTMCRINLVRNKD